MNKLQLFGLNVLSLSLFCLSKNFARVHGNAGVCRILEFAPPLDGNALINHVFKTIYLDKQDACRVACYLDNDCLSYNFGRHPSGLSVCQLSDSDHMQHPGDLKKSSGFIYRGTKNACAKNLCSLHGKCKIDPKDNTYYCKCEHGFEGKYCDKAIIPTEFSSQATSQPTTTPIATTQPLPDLWVKINNDPVCFGPKDDIHGSFSISKAGSLGALKLAHLSGTLVCFEESATSYWGCRSSVYGDKTLMTFISHPNQRSILLPRPNITQIARPEGSKCTNVFTYKLDGFNDESPELIFNTSSDPLQVTLDQQFWIWYGQDMADCSEDNNSGESCVDVFGWYIS